MVEALQIGSILQIGSSLQYRIESILGRGGFGLTYLATDTNLDTKVAIKEYLPDDFAERTSNSKVVPKTGSDGETYRWGLDRFIDEARILARFKHPNIVRVLNVFKKNNTAYMIMEYEEGSDLTEMFKVPGFCSEERLVSTFDAILSGLEQVHEHNIIHRDIKPANIYIRSDNTPVLLDFGSARKHANDKTQAMTRILTRGYAPYEQEVEGGGRQGPWTDIYSIGVTLYYAISKQLPTNSVSRFTCVIQKQSDPLPSINSLECSSEYSAGFLWAIEQALQIMPDDRPQTAKAFRSMLNSQTIENHSILVEPEIVDVSQDATVLAVEHYPNESATVLHDDAQSQPIGLQSAPPEPPKHSANKWIFFGVAAIILTLSAGNIFLFVSNNNTSTDSAQISTPAASEQQTPASTSPSEQVKPNPNSHTAVTANETILEQENKELQELLRIEDENQRLLEKTQQEYKAFEEAEAARVKAAENAVEAAKVAEVKRVAEAARIAEAKRAAEAAKITEAKRVAEAAELAEAKRVAEAAELAEAKRVAEAAKIAKAQRIAEAEKTAEAARIVAEAKAAEAARLAEEAKAVETARIAEEAKIAAANKLVEEAKIAEAARLAREARIAEQTRIEQEAKIADARRIAEEAKTAEAKRMTEAKKAAMAKKAEEARLLALAAKSTKTRKKKQATSGLSTQEQQRQDQENDMQTISRLFNDFRVHLTDCRVEELTKNSKADKDNISFITALCNQYSQMSLSIQNLRGNSVLGTASANIEIKSLLNQKGDHIYPSSSWNTLALKTNKIDGYWHKVQW